MGTNACSMCPVRRIRVGRDPTVGHDRPMGTDDVPTLEALQAELETIRQSPSSEGSVELVVARPAPEERAVLTSAVLDPQIGLRGDNWFDRGSRHTDDGSAEPDRQLTVMNSRAIAAIAGIRERWPLAGDQLYVDLDLATANLPPGSEVQVGEATIRITEVPHTGCAKFTRRFGTDAARFVNSAEGRELNLRGVNARVVAGGTLTLGDPAVVRSRPGATRG